VRGTIPHNFRHLLSVVLIPFRGTPPWGVTRPSASPLLSSGKERRRPSAFGFAKRRRPSAFGFATPTTHWVLQGAVPFGVVVLTTGECHERQS
jgi:hypothetical protein